MKTLPTFALGAVAALLLPLGTLSAQDNANPGGRRNFNPEEFRQRMEERMKAALKTTDEEWTVLQPLLEKVMTKQREAMGSRFGRPPGGGGGAGNDARRGGGSPEAQALRETLEKENAPAEEIQAKLTAVREQRKKAQAELDAAREELKKVVTTRQEAVLVASGILE